LPFVYLIRFGAVTINLPNNVKISIKFGDIFEEKSIIVIPVNDCFDTIVDDDLISSKSVHGQFIKRYFSDNLILLDNLIDEELKNLNYQLINKNLGKNKKYPIGTVISIDYNKTTFVLVALSEMNANYKCSCSPLQYMEVISKLLGYLHQHSNAKIVSLPVIGGGLSGVRPNNGLTSLIQYLVSQIELCGYPNPEEIHIIINKKFRSTVILRQVH
jgi:hypothetical protein